MWRDAAEMRRDAPRDVPRCVTRLSEVARGASPFDAPRCSLQGANPVMEVLGLEEKLEDPTLFEFVLVQALQGLLTLIGYLSIFISVPVMAYFLERPHTRGAREASVMLKLSFFQCAVILVTLFVLTTVETNENDDPDGSFKRGWYPVGMTVLLGALLGDILFIQFGMDLVRPFDLVKKQCFAKRAKTQARMNELCACSRVPESTREYPRLGAHERALRVLGRRHACLPAPDPGQGAHARPLLPEMTRDDPRVPEITRD